METPSTKYFEYISGYSVPAIPKSPISEADARQRRAYYEVAFDESGRVMQITKMLDARLSFRYEYDYDATGRVSAARMTGPDGNTKEIPLPHTKRQIVHPRAQ